jgi:hypothetical protein
MKSWKLIGLEVGGQECPKSTLFREGQFRPKSSVSNSQTADSRIHILIARNILRTLVSELDFESEWLESSGRGSREKPAFLAIFAILGPS